MIPRHLHAVSLVEDLTHDRLRLHPLVQEFAARLSDAAFRQELAAYLATAFDDFERLESHVVRLGIDIIVGDLRAGLWLCRDSSKDDPSHTQLAALEHVLDREAHSLRGWDPAVLPAHC